MPLMLPIKTKKDHVMEKVINMGKIEGIVKSKSFRLAGISRLEGYHLTKIYVGDNSDAWVRQSFPGTEIVDNVHSIIHDDNIDLVIMPNGQNEQLQLVAEVLQTGKNIRMV